MQERKPFKLAVKNIGTLLFSKIMCVVFILMAIFVVNLIDNIFVSILFQIFLLFMYFSFSYMSFWKEGSHDRNFIDLKRMDKDLFKGTKSGMFLAIPSLLLNLVFLLSRLGVFPDEFFGVYRFLNAQYLPLFVMLSPEGAALSSEISWLLIPLGFFLVLLTPALTGVAYYMGYRRFSLSQYVLYKGKEK